MGNNEKKRCAIYTRVSRSDSQKVDAQEHELREFAERRGWSVYKVYSDEGISGAKESRPALNQLMTDCRRRHIDVVAVWKFDRFARSVKQLVTSLDEFHSLGIDSSPSPSRWTRPPRWGRSSSRFSGLSLSLRGL